MPFPNRQRVIQDYLRYLRTSSDRQLKDWNLIGNYSLAERKVRDQYLHGDSSLIPLRGTGVERIEDDEVLLDCQRRFTALVNEYVLKNIPVTGQRFVAFFKEILTIGDSLLQAEKAPNLARELLHQMDQISAALYAETLGNSLPEDVVTVHWQVIDCINIPEAGEEDYRQIIAVHFPLLAEQMFE